MRHRNENGAVVGVTWRPIRESVSYGPERVHFYVGDFDGRGAIFVPPQTQKNAALSPQPQSTEKQGPYGALFLFGGILLEQRLWSGVVRSHSGRGRRRLWGPGAELSWANVSERPVAPKQIVLHEN
eukprot:COSAG05_NODE_12583_length_462_cov_1.024793_1_plen_126_part_00